jgi:hypothetical protein
MFYLGILARPIFYDLNHRIDEEIVIHLVQTSRPLIGQISTTSMEKIVRFVCNLFAALEEVTQQTSMGVTSKYPWPIDKLRVFPPTQLLERRAFFQPNFRYSSLVNS